MEALLLEKCHLGNSKQLPKLGLVSPRAMRWSVVVTLGICGSDGDFLLPLFHSEVSLGLSWAHLEVGKPKQMCSSFLWPVWPSVSHPVSLSFSHCVQNVTVLLLLGIFFYVERWGLDTSWWSSFLSPRGSSLPMSYRSQPFHIPVAPFASILLSKHVQWQWSYLETLTTQYLM